jgi:transmembrane sensor
MTDFQNISENDPDLILARQYGKVLAGEREAQDISDPMFKILVRARDIANRAETEIQPGDSESSWYSVESTISEIESRSGSNVLPLKTTKKWYWAAAAVILIAFTSLFLLRQTMDTDPRLLAEADTSISIVELTDGSTVTLRPNSRLYELASLDQLQSYSLNGEALFEVESHPGRTFSVEAGPGRVVVTGTRFNLTDRDERSTVYLLDGSVIFESADRARSVTLSSGEAAVISRDDILEEPFRFEPDEITGWTQNRLTFRDRQVSAILSELEFHYNITIQAPDEIRQVTLGGSVALENPDQSLEDLGIVLGGEFIQTDDQSYQFRLLP